MNEKRQRSPLCPVIGLGQVVKKLHKVKPGSEEDVAKSLDYKSVNGASQRMHTALKHFGLLLKTGKDCFKLTDDAAMLLTLNGDDPRRLEIIQKLALRPRFFAELNEKFGSAQADDKELRDYLKERGFRETAIGDVIRAYRATMEFAMTGEPSGKPQIISENGSKAGVVMEKKTTKDSSVGRLMGPGFYLPTITIDGSVTIKITEAGEAIIQFSGDITQEIIEKLSRFLTLAGIRFPEGISL